jgi:hypothetical protein
LCLVLWLGDIVSDLSDGVSALDDYSPGIASLDKSNRDGGRFSNRTGDNSPSVHGSVILSDPFDLYHPQEPIDYAFSRRIISVIYAREIFSLNHVLLI